MPAGDPMKYKLEIGLLCFLALFLFSINDPIIYFGGLIRRIPDLHDPSQYACAAQIIPENTVALFFSNSDGTLDWNTYNYYFSKSLYYLEPRALAYQEYNNFDLNEYQWLLAVHMDAQSVDQMAAKYHLQVVQNCDGLVVLSHANKSGVSQ